MIKGIIRLENDIAGKAGQLLILREDNQVCVVEREALEAVFAPAPEPEPVVEAEPTKRKKREAAPKAYGHYKTLEALLKAQARGRHMAEVRARRKAERMEAERVAAE